jgi:hypothetical protein
MMLSTTEQMTQDKADYGPRDSKLPKEAPGRAKPQKTAKGKRETNVVRKGISRENAQI